MHLALLYHVDSYEIEYRINAFERLYAHSQLKEAYLAQALGPRDHELFMILSLPQKKL